MRVEHNVCFFFIILWSVTFSIRSYVLFTKPHVQWKTLKKNTDIEYCRFFIWVLFNMKRTITRLLILYRLCCKCEILLLMGEITSFLSPLESYMTFFRWYTVCTFIRLVKYSFSSFIVLLIVRCHMSLKVAFKYANQDPTFPSKNKSVLLKTRPLGPHPHTFANVIKPRPLLENMETLL